MGGGAGGETQKGAEAPLPFLLAENGSRPKSGGVDYPRTVQEFDEWFPSE
jgi:hypothetical protein